MIIVGIIVAIIMFSTVVLIHEFGHFAAARKFGVKVDEFGLGIPPKAKELFTDKKGTVFTLNWLPLGGFVRLKGENLHLLEDKNDPEALVNKTYFQQSVILLGGVVMNFLLAIFIFSILFFIGVKPIGINDKISTDLDLKIIPTYEQALESGLLVKSPGVILQPVEDSLAQKSGIEIYDTLLSINETKILSPEDMINILGENKNSTLNFEILRKAPCAECPEGSQCKPCAPDEIIDIKIAIGEDGKIGSYVGDNIILDPDFKYEYGIIESIKYGTLETFNQSLLTVKAIGLLVRKIVSPETPQERTQAISEMKGPVGIVDLVANSLSAGVVFIVIIGAIISINLGVFNLLPIPALDGGRFLFITINQIIKKIFGKKAIGENTENIIHLGFFVVLIALSLIIGYNDVINILNR